jgi:iron(III) transport system ATP-binding protein
MLERDRPRLAAAASSPVDTGSPRVSIRNLSKIYRTRRGAHVALDNVSLDIGAGEFVVLLGPSGCGKTTLLRCIAGLEEPDSGEIAINGRPVFSSDRQILVPPERRELNMVFQSYALWPHMTVADNVAYPLRNSGVPVSRARERAAQTLTMVGLGDYGAAFPGQLSGGQQQRVALARAIVGGDGLVLFDEPLSNLDAKVRDRLRIELLNLQAEIGFSAVYVTHDQVEALALADRVAVMDVGRIAQVGSSADIYDNPTSRYVADFIGSANELRGTVASVGALAAVETPVGLLTGIPVGPGIVPGAQVWVMFRPEHCQLADSAPGTAPDSGGANALSGSVARTLYLGPTTQHVVTVAGQNLIVSRAGGARLAPGTPVTFTCAPERVRIFA